MKAIINTRYNDEYDEFKHDDLCIGIDLGTTNSAAAYINVKQNGDISCHVHKISRGIDMYSRGGEMKLQPHSSETLPSCVYYRQECGYAPVIGDFAKMQYSVRPHLVAKSIKSQMGRPVAQGLDEDIPDKSPAEISARILNHIISDVSGHFLKKTKKKICDAVITVPANFDSAMCKATRDAAELAGIKVKNEDGSERAILLSEPNAVIYDLINRIKNGEIPDRILDLRSENKKILVFDLGGGTLDITMHDIGRREDAPEVLKVNEIATNRYTLLGGDDFDEEIAKAMYDRYLKQWSWSSDASAKIRAEKKVVMSKLRVFAETLKIDISNKCSENSAYTSAWDSFDDDDDVSQDVGGNMDGTGYAYDDTFTKTELEDILSVFMAEELSFSDYKKLDSVKNTRNIIYPILDVLSKASAKLGTDNFTVDAVVLNGGMSKFYMVTKRLTEFFGFEPIVAVDPDLSVARGASVYHYYLHKYEQLKDDMRSVGEDSSADSTRREQKTVSPSRANTAPEEKPVMSVEWGKNILNDALYLGLKNGQAYEIIPTGAELPYTSELMKGFQMEPNQKFVSLPIKSRNLDGTYRKISSGNISFSTAKNTPCFVSFRVFMGTNKVITMQAWRSYDEQGNNFIDEGVADISIDTPATKDTRGFATVPHGSKLDPVIEINNLIQLCEVCKNKKSQREQSDLSKKIAFIAANISSASNKADFANVILDKLEKSLDPIARERLFVIARKLGGEWSDSQKKRLASCCMDAIGAELNGFAASKATTNQNIQAIYTLNMCASKAQLDELVKLHANPKYFQACIYTHAKTGSQVDWVYSKFSDDVTNVLKGRSRYIQHTAYAIGMALKADGGAAAYRSKKVGDVVDKLCALINSGKLTLEETVSCIIALGWICDRRNGDSAVSESRLSSAKSAIETVPYIYPMNADKTERSETIALKLINGESLEEDEEKFLLSKLEI